MNKVLISEVNLSNIASAIRDKFNTKETMTIQEMANNITNHTIFSAPLDCRYLCYHNRAQELLPYLNKTGTSNVTNMSYMFYLSSLSLLDLSNFDTANVTNMNHMFNHCTSVASLDLSSFDTSKVTDMSSMFYGCPSLTSLELSSFATSNVTNMSYMFQNCSSLTSLDLSSFTTSNVTNMKYMFYGCSSLTSLDLSSFTTSNVTNMDSMFSGCSSLTSLDLSSFYTSNVTNMGSMFSGCSSLTSLDLSSFATQYLTDIAWMFEGCSSLTSLDLSSFSTADITDMSALFSGCSSLTFLNLASWSFGNVTHWDGMFDDVPDDCLIYVANENYQTWITEIYPNLTNVQVNGGVACFTADTLVATPNGYKDIASLQIGDEIYSYDTQLEEKVIDTIQNIRVHNHINKIYSFNGLEVTGDHCFYMNDGTLRPAECLIEGDTLFNGDIVGPITITTTDVTGYDIKPVNNINYYVTTNNVLVRTEQIEGEM